jgi:hypothetical protein
MGSCGLLAMLPAGATVKHPRPGRSPARRSPTCGNCSRGTASNRARRNRPVPSRTSTRTRSGARFGRLARRFGRGHEKKAAIAVARTLICNRVAVMARGRDYADVGEDYYDQRDQRDREHLIRHHQKALARLGCQVTLIPPGDGTPLPAMAPASTPPPEAIPPVTGISPWGRLRRRCRAPAGVPKFRYRGFRSARASARCRARRWPSGSGRSARPRAGRAGIAGWILGLDGRSGHVRDTGSRESTTGLRSQGVAWSSPAGPGGGVENWSGAGPQGLASSD